MRSCIALAVKFITGTYWKKGKEYLTWFYLFIRAWLLSEKRRLLRTTLFVDKPNRPLTCDQLTKRTTPPYERKLRRKIARLSPQYDFGGTFARQTHVFEIQNFKSSVPNGFRTRFERTFRSSSDSAFFRFWWNYPFRRIPTQYKCLFWIISILRAFLSRAPFARNQFARSECSRAFRQTSDKWRFDCSTLQSVHPDGMIYARPVPFGKPTKRRSVPKRPGARGIVKVNRKKY